ncbi:hypothetical protein GCM10008910_23290 [Faecalicatena orotica]|uniref:glycosyltransferase family 4 protein n=1 Tax=Faecalicatena orotica TaxID=1544 RepID=UPI0031D7DF52
MKITIITGPFLCLPPHTIGAVEKLWYGLGDYWRKYGHEVVFISKRPLLGKNDDNNIYLKGSDRSGRWIYDFLIDFIYSLKALLRMPKTDVVVLNTLWSPLMIRLFRFKYKLSIFSVERFPKKQIGVYDRIGGVDLFRCNSTAVYNAVKKQAPASIEKSLIVPNYIDTNIFSERLHEGKQNNTVIISFAGRVNKEKGLDYLFKACNHVAESCKIQIIIRVVGARDTARGGSGEEYARHLDELAPFCKVEWIDAIYNPNHLAETLRQSDIFCYPSIAEQGETFGVAPLEAMGLGIPIIVSSLECFGDFVINGENALTFNHHSMDPVHELESALFTLIENKKKRQEIGKKGAITAQKFNAQNVAQQYLNIFEQYLNKKDAAKK